MNLFFEESGDFKAGVALSQSGEAYQVEMQSGKRSKVKDSARSRYVTINRQHFAFADQQTISRY